MRIVTEVPTGISTLWKNNPNIGRRQLAIDGGISEQEARFYAKLLRAGHEIQIDNTSDSEVRVKKSFGSKSGTIELNSYTINTLDKAIEVAKIDLELWDIDRWVVNPWTVTMKIKDKPVVRTNYQLKVWLKPKVVLSLELALRGLIKQLPKHKPQYAAYIGNPEGDFLLEVSLFDVHFGMLAWAAETNTDWDIKIAEDLYQKTVETLLSRSSNYKSISRILFPFGNDFFHLNSPEALTPKAKNRLDFDSRFPKIYQAGKMSVIKAIDFCMGVAPVDVVWIPGNHDPETSYYLADSLREHYSTTDRVNIDMRPLARKYYTWGKGLIGFTHGDEEPWRDLPAIMAAECSHFHEADYREWHVGHNHKKKMTNYLAGDTFAGVVVRVLPSITGTDAWHYKKGYVKGIRAGEGFLWDKNEGCVNYLTAHV